MSRELQPYIRNYISDIDLSAFIGLSLTLKQQFDGQHLDPSLCSQNLRHFMNVINKKVFGNRFSRHGHKLQIFPVLENSLGERLHYHMILEIPRETNLNHFKDLIRTEWQRTRFGHREIHIDETIDMGWTNYITKFHSSKDQVDWENVHLNR